MAQARILHILLFVISHSWCLITSCWFYLLHFSSLSRSSILLPSSQCCPPHHDCRFQIASCLLSNPWNSFSTYCLCVFWECISAHVVPCLKPINVFPWPHNTVWTLSHSLYSSFPSGSFVSPIIFLFSLSVSTMLDFYLLQSSTFPSAFWVFVLAAFYLPLPDIVILQVRKLKFRRRKWLTGGNFICFFVRKQLKSQSKTKKDNSVALGSDTFHFSF